MQAPGKPGPKILFELSQVETGRAVQDLRHGVQAKVGHGIRTLLCLRATRAKSQYKVGLGNAKRNDAWPLGFTPFSANLRVRHLWFVFA